MRPYRSNCLDSRVAGARNRGLRWHSTLTGPSAPGRRKPMRTMSIASLKLKYAAAAFLTVLFGTLIVMGLLAWQHRVQAQRLGDVAQAFSRERISRELQARAASTARHAADSAAPALRSGDRAVLAQRMQRLADDKTVAAIVVRDFNGNVVYQWHRRSAQQAGALQWQVFQPARVSG